MKEHLEQLKEELSERAVQIFDVREAPEWRQGHLASAFFTPLSELKDGMLPDSVSKNAKTYLYCRSGSRVHPASQLLKAMGFTDVIPLSEGYAELVQNGFSCQEAV